MASNAPSFSIYSLACQHDLVIEVLMNECAKIRYLSKGFTLMTVFSSSIPQTRKVVQKHCS